MQRLDLRNNLNEILKRLKTNQIVEVLSQSVVDRNNFLQLLIESKAGYDQAVSDKETEKVFIQFNTQTIYSTSNFSALLSLITTSSPINSNSPHNLNRSSILSNNALNDFYSFHKTLISTFKLIDNLLLGDREIFDAKNDFNITEAQNKGNLILEIIDEDNISLKKLIEILESLRNLIETVYLMFDKIEKEKFESSVSIAMADSGSDINFIFKLPEKAANLIAQIMNEFWDFIINNKNYKLERKLKTVENSITVLGKVKQAKDEGIIDSETAEVLKKGIVENTEKIILRNTLTKQIVMETKEFSNRQLLLEQSQRYLLESSKENTEDTSNNMTN